MASLKTKKRSIPRKGSANKSTNSVQQRDPIVAAVQAIMTPFSAPKGIAAPLIDGRPSQKFMAKAQGQITLTSGQMFCFMVCPNVANDSTSVSMVYAIGNATAGTFGSAGAWKSATAGDAVVNAGNLGFLSTNTPYSANASLGYNYASVGSAVKFTYEGAEFYRGGTLRYLYDSEGAYNRDGAGSWTAATVTPATLVSYVNAAPNSIRQSINKDNVVEINCSHSDVTDYKQANGVNSTAYGVGGDTDAQLIGGSAATRVFGVSPTMLGYYINTSANTISFHVDLVEHWSIAHPTIQALQTESYSHASMSSHVASLLANTRQAHALQPNSNHVDVAKTTLKAMKSPLGHEVLNIGLRAALA